MPTIFYFNSIPDEHNKQLALIDLIESAEGDVLLAMKKELFELPTEQLCEVVNLFGKTTSDRLSFLAIDALRAKGCCFSDSAKFLSQLFKNYANGRLKKKRFESLFVEVVTYAQASSMTNLVNASLSEVFREREIADKLKSKSITFLDEIIAKAFERSLQNLDFWISFNSMLNLTCTIPLPKSINALALSCKARSDDVAVNILLENIFTRNTLTKEYLDVITAHFDVDVFCNVCESAVTRHFPMKSINLFVNEFGESALFSKACLKSYHDSLADKLLPHWINDLLLDEFDTKKIPLLSAFIMDNVGAIYDSFVDGSSVNFRYGLLKLFSDNDRVGEIIHHEVKRLRSLEYLPQLENHPSAYVETIDELRRNKSFNYKSAIEGVGHIGLFKAEPHLQGVSLPVLNDILNAVDLSGIDQREIFKIYPASKGLLLEQCLGL